MYNHKLIIAFLISIGLLFSTNKVLGQGRDFEFQRDFLKKLHYPDALRNACTATFTNLLIDITDDGSIKGIYVSDSAPQQFKDAVNDIRGSLNLDLLRASVIKNNWTNSVIIIPVFYVFSSNYCVNSFDLAGELAENYYNFNGKALDKPVHNLKPIIALMYKPVH